MLGGLSATVDPILLADSGERLSGRVPIQSMARLKAQLLDEAGEVDIDLVFERSEGANLRRMRGRLVAHVALTCQRCLEAMSLDVVARPDTILLREGEPDPGLPPEADVLTVGAAPVSISELIEEELLLALPMVPMHVLAECPARKYIGAADAEEKSHPFAALARRKQEHE
jgi:uncharacterized protein